MAYSSHTHGPPPRRVMGPSEERALLERLHVHGDLTARDELVERMLPFVRHIARSYADRGELLDDLIQVGSIGLINAIDRFDPERGVRLSTYAAPNISGEIKRHFRDRAWSVRTPRDLQELYQLLRSEIERFTSEHGRSPTVPELCRLTERDEEQVLDALSAGRNFRAASLDQPTSDDGASLGELLGSSDGGFERAEDRAVLDRGLRALGERERRIVLLRYVEGLSQREIADIVGISQMHVSRLLRRSIDDLRASILKH